MANLIQLRSPLHMFQKSIDEAVDSQSELITYGEHLELRFPKIESENTPDHYVTIITFKPSWSAEDYHQLMDDLFLQMENHRDKKFLVIGDFRECSSVRDYVKPISQDLGKFFASDNKDLVNRTIFGPGSSNRAVRILINPGGKGFADVALRVSKFIGKVTIRNFEQLMREPVLHYNENSLLASVKNWKRNPAAEVYNES